MIANVGTAAITLTVKSLVSFSSPIVIVAVIVITALSAPTAGLVTTPASVSTAVSLEDQVTTESCNPPEGNDKLEVTSFKSVKSKAVVASATNSASVGPVGVSSLQPATANTNVNAVIKVNNFFIFFLQFLLVNTIYTV